MDRNDPATRMSAPSNQIYLGDYLLGPVVQTHALWTTHTGWDRTESNRVVRVVALRPDQLPASGMKVVIEQWPGLFESLVHPTIPRVLARGMVDGVFYVVTGDATPETLQERIGRAPDRRLTVAETADVVLQAAESLMWLHTRAEPIVHEALDPRTLHFVAMSNEVQLSNAGLVHALRKAGLPHFEWPVRYCAPEHFDHDRAIGPGVDQFVLASLAFECLAGVPAHADGAKGAKAMLAGFRPQLPDDLGERRSGLTRTLHRAWSGHAEMRHPSVAAFAADFARSAGLDARAVLHDAQRPVRDVTLVGLTSPPPRGIDAPEGEPAATSAAPTPTPNHPDTATATHPATATAFATATATGPAPGTAPAWQSPAAPSPAREALVPPVGSARPAAPSPTHVAPPQALLARAAPPPPPPTPPARVDIPHPAAAPPAPAWTPRAEPITAPFPTQSSPLARPDFHARDSRQAPRRRSPVWIAALVAVGAGLAIGGVLWLRAPTARAPVVLPAPVASAPETRATNTTATAPGTVIVAPAPLNVRPPAPPIQARPTPAPLPTPTTPNPVAPIAVAPSPHPPVVAPQPSPPLPAPVGPVANSNGPATVGAIHDMLERAVNDCAARTRHYGRHIYVGLRFDRPHGSPLAVVVEGAPILETTRQCIQDAAQTARSPQTAMGTWQHSYYLRIP